MEKENIQRQETELKENKNIGKGGVYQIKNKLNGKIYIGSSCNMEARWRAHRNHFLNGGHENKHLRNYIKKLRGETEITESKIDEIFHFGCLEYEDDLVKRFAIEQEYLTLLFDDGKMCYNHKKFAGPQYNYLSSDPESTREKLSIALKAKWSDARYRAKMCIINAQKARKPDTILKMSNSLKKKWSDPVFKAERKIIYNSPEHKEKISIAVKKTLEIKLRDNPEFKKTQLENLKRAINRPEIKRKAKESKIKRGEIKPFFLISNTGTIFYIESFKLWLKEHKLGPIGISEVRDGKKLEHKGYRLHISPEVISKENQKFFNISKMANLYVINCDKHLYILSDKTYRENAMRKIQNL